MFGQPNAGSGFGTSSASAGVPSVFGAGPSTSTASMFGSGQAPTNTAGVFGTSVTNMSQNTFTSAPAFGTPAGFGSVTGMTTSSANTVPFGSTSAMTSFGSNTINAPTFGTSAVSQSSGFGSSTVNQPSFGSSTVNQPSFGSSTVNQPSFGSSTVNQPSFGSSTLNQPSFGSSTVNQPSFGSSTVNQPSFGSSTVNQPSFGSSTVTQPSFGSSMVNQPSTFGSSTVSQPSFGSSTVNQSAFGASTVNQPTFGSTTVNQSAFGSTTVNQSAFGASTGNQPPFGSTTVSQPSFGSSMVSQQSFGSSTVNQSVFGSSTVNQPNTGTTAPTSMANLPTFGTSTSNPTAFGSLTSNPPTFGLTTPNQPVQTSFRAGNAGTDVRMSSSLGIVQKNVDSVSSNLFASSNPVFSAASASAVTSPPSTSVASVFGLPTSQTATTQSTSILKALVEGKSEPNASASTFLGGTVTVTQSSTLFSKATTAVSITSVAPAGQTSSNTAASVTSVAPAGQTSSNTAASRASLFGKPTTSTSSKVLFGKPSSVGQSEARTEKPEQSSDKQILFGKLKQSTGPEMSLFGKSSDAAREAGPSTSIERSTDQATRSSHSRSTKGNESEAKRRVRRRSTLEDIQRKVAIVCTQVPPAYNNKDSLRRHFQKFGKVSKVYVNPAKQSVIIHFSTHEAAAEALVKGRVLDDGHPLHIFWAAHTPRKLAESSSENRLSDVPNELDDELASMRGTNDVADDTEHATRDIQPGARKARVKSDQTRPSKVRGLEPKNSSKRPRNPRPMAQDATAKKGVGHISLKALSKAVGQSAAERYEILTNRDKIIKLALGTSKRSDLATAEVIRGTCQDMCPEKERYVREERRRLSFYEMVPGTDLPGQNPRVDHARAIKEYSRSSADQDMPLPSELRPPLVLGRTMDYLVNNIMDLGADGKWADWYEFLWSRTRSIRKDITQQQLCDTTAVDITEKQVRFHIYCAERLCEEDMMAFDQKINTENLTKCLQTLKEMYHDLGKKDVRCPREKEFRAYMVLMNLNEGDTLREVQQLSDELRLSPAVRFATTVHSALNTNNYIRFFKLVRRAPFLYGCILHRYFNQVRSQAIQRMLRAYKITQASPYPASEFLRLLAFEGLEEVTQFCLHHGLSVQDGKVWGRFIHPETALASSRSILLIESKQNDISVGEVVNGGPCPPNVLQEPTSSFNEYGQFIGEDVAISSDTEEAAALPTDTTRDVVTSQSDSIPAVTSQPVSGPSLDSQVPVDVPAKPLGLPYSNEAIKEVARDMFLEVINEHVQNMSETLVKGIDIYLGNADWVYESVQSDVVNELSRAVASEARVESQRMAHEIEARRKAELSALRGKVISDAVDNMVESVLQQEIAQLARQQYRDVEDQLTERRMMRVAGDVAVDLLQETIQEEICDVAESVFEIDVVERIQKLDDARAGTQLLITARLFRVWRNRYAARLRLKRSIQTFPPAPSLQPQHLQVAALIPASSGISHGVLHLGGVNTTLDSTANVLQNELKLKFDMTLYQYWKRQRHTKAWAPFTLGPTFYKRLLQASRTNDKVKPGKLAHSSSQGTDGTLYWKLLVSLPDVSANSSIDDEFAQRTIVCCDWLRSKFKKGAAPHSDLNRKTEVLSLYTEPITLPPYHRGSLRVCVRAVNGFPEDEDSSSMGRSDALGTAAILFYIGEVGPDNVDCYRGEVQSRLFYVLESLPKAAPVPLLVLMPAQSLVHAQDLNLDLFVEEGMVSDIRVVHLHADIEELSASKQVLDSLLWLATQCPVPHRITSDTLRDLVEMMVTQEFATPVYQNLTKRRRLNLLHQSPEVLIGYYNDLICHVAEVVSADMLQEISWPVAEFSSEGSALPVPDWNTADHLEYVRDTVLSLQLPEYDGPSDATRWSDALECVHDYICAVADDAQLNVAFFSKIQCILRKLERQFEAACHTCLRLDDCEPEAVNLPWTDIVYACVESRLAQTDWSDMTRECCELMAHYVTSMMESYRPPSVWIQTLGELDHAPSLHETMIKSGKRKLEESMLDVTSPPKMRRLDQSASFIDLSVQSETRREAQDSIHQLNSLLVEEKAKNSNFEEYLRKSLIADEVFHTPSTIRPLSGLPNSATTVSIASPLSRMVLSSNMVRTTLYSTPTAARPRDSNYSTPVDMRPLVQNFSPAHSKRAFSVEEDIDDLNLSIHSLRRADLIYEMKLKSYLTET